MKGYHHDRPSCNRQHADLYPPPTHVFGLPPPLLCPGASRDLAKEAAERGTHVQYLETLIEGEAHLREDRRTQRRVMLARFPVLKTLDQFNWSWPKKINRLQVQNLFRLKFIEDKANVIFLGGVGLGKSHLATALGYAACLQGYSVRFTTAIDAINTLSAAHGSGRLKTEIKKYLKPRVLILDELGYTHRDRVFGSKWL
jgi:DNA replication protein DnaC